MNTGEEWTRKEQALNEDETRIRRGQEDEGESAI